MTTQEGWLFGRYSAADAQDSLELLHRVSSGGEAATPAFQEWQRQRATAGAAIAVLAREKAGGRLVGQAAIVPTRISLASRVLVAGLALDPVTDPDYQSRDLAAALINEVWAQAAAESMSFTYGFPSQPFHSAFVNGAGFKSAGSALLLFLPLNPERLAAQATHGHTAFRAASVARRVWRVPPPASRQEALPGLDLTEVDWFDGSFAAFWDRVRQRFPVMVVRDPTYLNWRYVDVPTREYKAFAARSEGEVRGFIALRAAQLGQFSAGLIADLVVEASAEGRAAGRLLIDQARCYFKERDVDVVASLSLRHTDEFRLLRSRGFWVSPKFLEPRPFRLVLRCHDEGSGTSRLAYDLKNWFLSLGDCDVG